ncbi:hypothetical protein A9Q99_09060 [Gammaproteobacteria bacterium 45_16_T64]|mgnify:CR=1 FL=1|nr:hypothetical protein A9Q99_09060 [Gammaproteobacteria bacterium 45_16_T64]
MAKSQTITLNIGNAIPNAGDNESNWIISAWEGADKYIKGIEFNVEDPYQATLVNHQLSLDASDLIQTLRNAQKLSGGFASYLQSCKNEEGATQGKIVVTLVSEQDDIEPYSQYHSISVFVQQLVLAMNIALPGSCQILNGVYEGEGAGLFEPPQIDSTIFTNGWLSAFDAEWPILKPIKFEHVWHWLDQRKTSETDTALSTVNKVMFCLLDLAHQSPVYSAGNVLLVSHMLELFGQMEDDVNHNLLRERISIILGHPSDKADSFNELYRMKHSLIRSEQPIKRPAVIYHDSDDEIIQQLEMHNSPVEQALAIVLALIQDLVIHNSSSYHFSERVVRN